MAYYNAAAALVFVGKLPHEMDIHRIGRVADVEMHIDVGVELARQLKNAADLTWPIFIVARGATYDFDATLESFDQKRVSTGITDQSFLRKYADLDVRLSA